MRTYNFFFAFFIAILVVSCTTQKTINNNYLQNVNDTTGPVLDTIPETVIQKNDLLSIRVFSMSINPEIDIPYNLPQTGTNSESTTGFLVDRNGNIEYPQIGKIHVEGLTKAQLADTISRKLEGSLKNPSVIVRFLNYKITVLGEVGNPSTFTVPTEKLTILEALGLAGDITEFGNRSTVKVLREQNGLREIGIVDLTSKNMFSSPYYHLQQNDVVFVEQNRRKTRQQDQQQLAQQIGLATSIITAIALILNFLK